MVSFMIRDSIVNFSNSILKHYNVELFHDSIQEIDEVLKTHKKIVVMLFDGLGTHILEKHLSPEAFMRQHIFKTIISTNPPTTVAATTGFLSGRYPIETGWMGWHQYFSNEEVNLEVFTNHIGNTGNTYKIPMLINKYCPYENIISLMNNKKADIAKQIMPFPIDEKGPKNLNQFKKAITKSLKQTDEKFIYAYWTKPDSLMHKYGVNHRLVHQNIKDINKTVEKIAQANKDTLFITLSDHGMSDIVYINIGNNKKITDMMERPMSLEKRCASFKIKRELREEFLPLLKKTLGWASQFFDFYTKEEIIKNNFFGEGKILPVTLDFIGDFIVVAKDIYTLISYTDYKKEVFHVAAHAGQSVEETSISICVYNK